MMPRLTMAVLLSLALALAACGANPAPIGATLGGSSANASGESGTGLQAGETDTTGSAIINDAPLGEAGNLDAGSAIEGTSIGSGAARPVAPPAGTFDP